MNNAATNECYNEQFLSIKSGCYNKWMLQWTVFITKIRMLHQSYQLNHNATTNNATTNKCYNKQILSIKSQC